MILSRGGIKLVLIGLNPNCRLERLVPVTKRLARDGGGCVEPDWWTGGRGSIETGCWVGSGWVGGCWAGGCWAGG